jgi:hypothetical protein
MSTQTNTQQPPADPIFEAICQGELFAQLAQRKFSAGAIANWQGDPTNLAKLQKFLEAFELQAQVLTSRARNQALLTLMSLFHNPESKPETIRKACADVLKTASARQAGPLSTLHTPTQSASQPAGQPGEDAEQAGSAKHPSAEHRSASSQPVRQDAHTQAPSMNDSARHAQASMNGAPRTNGPHGAGWIPLTPGGAHILSSTLDARAGTLLG